MAFNTYTPQTMMGGKGSVNTRNRQQVSVCRALRTCGSVIIQKGMDVSKLSGEQRALWDSVASLNWTTHMDSL